MSLHLVVLELMIAARTVGACESTVSGVGVLGILQVEEKGEVDSGWEDADHN
jgi:hypothetical protein